MEQLQEGLMELAVTYVNLACMYDAWGHRSDLEGEETAPKDWDGRIWECLDRAMEYLEDPKAKRDGYYAFTCSKCAGTVGYFGQFREKRTGGAGRGDLQQMIKGLELSKQYYERYGKPMIAQQFPEYENRIAVGLVGSGSECFGYDDEISEDHDFEAGFCMWLTREDDKAIGFPLFRAYKKLPPEFMGIKKQDQSFFGGNRRGVLEIGEFYSQFTGSFGAPTKWSQWMTLPESALAEAVNGQVFRDDLGEFTRIRTELQKGFPEDVRLKKLAARTALAAQAGQYNFSRCIRRREMGAAGLAIAEFVKMAVSAVYLLNRRYTPYYKWMIRGLRELEHLSHLADPLQEFCC